jgi:zinc protease
MRKLLVIAVVAVTAALPACGPKPGPAPIVLPGDGDAHVVKPPPVTTPGAVDPWAGHTDLIAAPAARPPAAIELPKIDELKLSNGLQVYVIKSDRLPLISVQLAVRAGRMHEPRARLGVAEVTADMLVKGTRRHDAAQLAQAIDFVGGTIAADSTFEATMVSCSVLSKNASTCFDLVPEMIMQPTFPEAELAKMRDLLAGTVRQRLEDPGALASAHAQNLLWGDQHVRGWINSEQSLAAIKRDDVVAWHRTWFVPGNAMLVVTGDVDVKKLRGDLERTFGTWRKGPVPPAPTYAEQGLSGTRIRLVDRPGLTQTQIRVAQFGIKHDDPRFFDTLVWNYVLGGGGTTSRLARAVPYGASSSFDRNLDRGSFMASTIARNADAVTITKRVLTEISRLAKDGPTQEEIATAVGNLTGGYALRFQSAADLGAALLNAELHRFGYEYLTNYPLAVGQVDVASAKRAVSEILDPKSTVIVLVGDAKDLEPALKTEGWRYEKVSFSQPVTAPAPLPEVSADPKAIAAAQKLIDEALVAKGGKAKLAALKSLKLTAVGTTTIQGQTVPVEIARAFVFPDQMRIDATIKAAKGRDVVVTVGAAGSVAWQRGPDAKTGDSVVTEVTGAGLASVDFERWREPELILLKAAAPGAKLSVGADETLDGKAYAVVKLRAPSTDVEVAIYVDKKTKLIGRMSYSDGGNTETDEFSDYRDIAGLKVAYKRTSTGPGRSTTLDLTSVEIDPKLEAALFAKPAAK